MKPEAADRRRLVHAVFAVILCYAVAAAALVLWTSPSGPVREGVIATAPVIRLSLSPPAEAVPAAATAANVPAPAVDANPAAATAVPTPAVDVNVPAAATANAAAPVPAAPAPVAAAGVFDAHSLTESAFLVRLNELLQRTFVYPARARRRSIEGLVTLSLSVSAGGELVSVAVSTGSGSPVLDEAAVRTVTALFPVFPGPGRTLQTALTVEYSLR